MQTDFDNQRHFLSSLTVCEKEIQSESSLCSFLFIILLFYYLFACVQCYNMQLCGYACQFWILWFLFSCSISSTCFLFCGFLLFLWRCVAFVFCMPSSSDLLWPPSAREHSADPSGKFCTLDLQCNPSPVSSCFTLLSHQGCTILAKITPLDKLCSPTTLTQPSYPPS